MTDESGAANEANGANGARRFDEQTRQSTPVAIGKFERVQVMMGARWRKTQLYPERWLVEGNPTEEELKAIGFEKGIAPGKGDPPHP